MTRAEYFAGVVLEFVKDINEKNPNLNDVEEYLPKNLDSEIQRLEQERPNGDNTNRTNTKTKTCVKIILMRPMQHPIQKPR